MRGAKMWLGLAVLGLLLPSCGGDSETGPSSTGPEVTGCSTVRYQGVNFPVSACGQGASSAQINGTVNGVTACINVTCSAGCVSTATLCSS
jgi:hypothetical protein